jgi:putative membrane protein
MAKQLSRKRLCHDSTLLTNTMEKILHPDRLAQLQEFDKNILTYQPYSFWIVFWLQGRNFKMIFLPLLLLLIFDVWWCVVLEHFLYVDFNDTKGGLSENGRDRLENLESLVSPILIPVSFLLVFRLTRAAVRYWDSRSATGKLVETCRTLISTAVVGCRDNPVELVRDFAIWVCVFPVAVKVFLRPHGIEEGNNECYLSYLEEKPEMKRETDSIKQLGIGQLLSESESQNLFKTSFAPLYVLNKLRALTFDVDQEGQDPSPKQAMLFRHLNEEIDVLTGAWGALERINGTPLPFVYVVHLRTFLVLYLLGWHSISVALNGWVSIFPLLIVSWGLLGIEAAAVECERPFNWNKNHLPLGKMCIVVSMNVHQTLDQLKGHRDFIL